MFKELCVEFFASVSFEDAMMDPNFARALVFRLRANIGSTVLRNFLGGWVFMSTSKQGLKFLTYFLGRLCILWGEWL